MEGSKELSPGKVLEICLWKRVQNVVYEHWRQRVMRKNQKLMCHEKSNKISHLLGNWRPKYRSGKRNFKAEDFLVNLIHFIHLPQNLQDPSPTPTPWIMGTWGVLRKFYFGRISKAYEQVNESCTTNSERRTRKPSRLRTKRILGIPWE